MIKELKLQFYKETDSLLGGTFKDYVRDALWNWIEDKLSHQVQAAVIKKNAEGLLPCPFCGGEPFVNKKDASLEVLCPKCLINGFVGIEKQNIIEAWNKRI